MSTNPFDPPHPPRPTAAETATTIVAGVGLIAVAAVLHPVLHALRIPAMFVPETPYDPTRELAAVADTKAPIRDVRGNAACTRCRYFVPYASMSLNEHGYFCARCAADLST